MINTLEIPTHNMADIKHLEQICSQVRRDIVRMVHAVNSGHPGGSLGCTEYFVALYFEILKHDPKNFSMDGINQDIRLRRRKSIQDSSLLI